MNLDNLDGRLVAYLLWGLGTVAVYGVVLRGRWHSFRSHHDARSRRELLAGISLFLTALCAGMATWVVLFGEVGSSARSWFVAFALGAFTGAGIVMATERKDEETE